MAFFGAAQTEGPFKKTFLAFPITDTKPHLEYGDKVILPDSLLHELMLRDIQYPMMFKLQVKNSKASVYCSVSEFTAKDGQIILPQWMMNQLGLSRGNEVDLYNVMLQKGTFVTLRPHTYKFVEKHLQPERVLESHLNKYATLTRGTTIQIQEGGEVYYFDITALKPARAVCILDTDLKLDLDEPLDIKEYEGKMKKQAEEKMIEDKFSRHANIFHQDQMYNDMTMGLPQSPNDMTNTDNDESYTNIFAANSDDEDEGGLRTKMGTSGYSIKRNVVNHVVSPIAKPSLPNTMSNNSYNTNSSVPSKQIKGPSESEAEEKRKRDDLVRQQRAALFANRGKTMTSSNNNNNNNNNTINANMIQTQEAQNIMGLGKEQQGVVDLVKKTNELLELSTTVEGEWLIYRDQYGRLVKREPIQKGFAMTGIGNSIKRD